MEDDTWITGVLGRATELVRREEWGVLTERGVQLPSGLEVEFGFVSLSWAPTDPVDPGTARVVRDGCRPIVDAYALFEHLIAAT